MEGKFKHRIFHDNNTMAKKRKGSSRSGPKSPKEFDEKDAKIGTISTYEDVADSEDDFHIQRDKVMLDDGPEAKRQRKWADEDAFLQQSDEEILGYDDASSDDDEEDKPAKNSKERAASDSEASGSEEEEEEEGWGTSRKDYYNTDEIQTEADALDEEAEAKRLQQKKLAKMSEADFGFDEDEWKTAAKDDDEDETVTEVLKDIEITEDMGPEERLRLLQTRYPEFEHLANEFVQLHPMLEDLNDEIAATGSSNTVAVLKARALGAYLGAISMYFAILASPAMDGGKLPIDPIELRDHAVMESLLGCRQMWLKASKVEAHMGESFDGVDSEAEESDIATPESESEEEVRRPSNKAAKAAKAKADAKAARAAKIAAAEEELADLDDLIPSSKLRKSKAAKKLAVIDDSDSDFGEEETLDARAAAEKAATKKSLRFYTSQIAQKANKRSAAGADAGGDADLPYRERLRDRQARLNAEAEKRGKKLDEYGRGAALGDDSDGEVGEEDRQLAKEVREEEDEYYDMVAQTSKSKKAARAAAAEEAKAAAEAGKLDRVEGEEDVDGKRAIGYVIQKNKGLAPKRKKEVRNPRVKKRMKYEEKKKKLSSMRAIYKGGEERGGYSGEKTGIKPGLVKSIKL